MKTISSAILLLAIIAFANTSCIFIGPPIKGNGNVVEETRELTGFNKIKASAGTNVYISQGDIEKVVVRADENILDAIRTEVEGDVLIVTHIKSVRKATTNKVFVTVKNLEQIKAAAGANIYTENLLKADQLILSCSAGSNLKLNIDASDLKISSSAGSNIYLEGNAKNMKASGSAGSNIKAESLEVQNCEAKASSGANVYVRVVEELEAKASSGGNVFYYGSPNQINISSSSGGNVIKRGGTSDNNDVSRKQVIGTWKLSKGSTDGNMTGFTLNADSSAVVVWGDSAGRQEKTGKWKSREEMKVGNNMFGISVNGGIFITVEMDSSHSSSWGLTAKGKNGEIILAIGDDNYEKQ